MGIWYATREQVKSSLDAKETARNNAQIDSAIEAESRAIESLMHRVFYPNIATRYFDFPSSRSRRPWNLWLDADELISVTTLISGGTTIAASDYFLEPVNAGPPYTHIQIDLSSAASFSSGDTYQRSTSILGVYGYRLDESAAGTISEALDASETDVDVSNSAAIGVGSLIRVDTERMRVTGKTMKDTTQNIGADLAAAQAVVTVAVSDGTAFSVDEVILVDSERMLIVDIAGNNLTVKRQWDGSTLAAHTTGADIYAPRTLVVERGVLGTTAATHSTSATVYRFDFPGLINELCIARAQNRVLQKGSGYARMVGAGENQRPAPGRGLKEIQDEAYAAHGRKLRMRAV